MRCGAFLGFPGFCIPDHLVRAAGAQVTWKESLSNNAAWDTLTWFAALIGMASYLNKYGFIAWFSNQVRRCPPAASHLLSRCCSQGPVLPVALLRQAWQYRGQAMMECRALRASCRQCRQGKMTGPVRRWPGACKGSLIEVGARRW